MINVIKRICSFNGCDKTPNFNYEGQRSALFCTTHKLDNMFNVTSKRCLFNGCKISPAFNLPGQEKGIYCDTHKQPGMVNVVTNKCKFAGCQTYATFNNNGCKNGMYCALHKQPEMVNVTNKRCEISGCLTKPLYGFTIATHCAKHKVNGMGRFITNNCIHIDCKIRANYNFPTEKQGIYCTSHKLPEMVNVKDKVCVENGCFKIPSFNFYGLTESLYCFTHKQCGMVNIKETTCKTQMCSTQVSKKFKRYDGYCLNCYIHLFPDKPVSRNYKTKEKAVREFLTEQFTNYTWVFDKPIDNGASRKRPDALLDLSDQVVIIEVDENQHCNYDCSCENKRLMEISMDVNHRPVVFIRFNPDDYIDKFGNKIPSCWKIDGNNIIRVHKNERIEWETRLNTLKEQVIYWCDNKTNKTVEVIQLFYNQNM
jgi:hypothetical protein